MSENTWLVRHAIKNLWCDPSADGRIIMCLARISEDEGETFGMRVSEYSIKMPEEGEWYHVYQIGNLSTDYVGIPSLWDGWSRLDRVINAYGINIRIYDAAGHTYPSALIWIRQLPNDNVVLAISGAENLIDLKTTTLYVAFYSGEFTNGPDFNDRYKCEVNSLIPRSQVELENIFRLYQSQKQLTGKVQAYVNGCAVHDLNRQTAETWDYVEIFRDGLAKESHDFTIGELLSFSSELDTKRKYLLHPNKDDSTIEFNNDVEIHLFSGNDGRYYPVHKKESIRQLTHRDYSIPVDAIQSLRQLANWPQLDNLIIRLTIKHSGFNHKLSHEKTQLLELYKLTDQQITEAMVGMNATIPEWQAANLENSSLCRLAASRYYDISKALVTDTYGYDASSKLISDVPVKLDSSGEFKLPPLFTGLMTVYEYDRFGSYLGYHELQRAEQLGYHPSNQACGIIEPIIGKGLQVPHVYYDVDTFTFKDAINYRVFKCPNKNGVSTHKNYIDITGSDEYSVNNAGLVTWKIDTELFTPVIVSDEYFINYAVNGNINSGIIDFSIRGHASEDWDIPHQPKVVDVFLGEYLLIPEVDYHIQWPRIVIYSKERLSAYHNTPAPILVRAIGLSKTYKSPEHGFVVDGLLSNNNRFDVRDGKVVRITVDGHLKHRSDVVFREDATVGIDGLVNGMPYVVNDTMVPLRTIIDTSYDLYELKAKDEEFTARLENYLSTFIPQKPTVKHNQIANRYRVFSPILNKVIADLRNGLLVPVEDGGSNVISTEQFDYIMSRYVEYLEYDPIRLNVDPRYVVTEPHVYPTLVELSPLHFSLVERINDRYLGNKVVLNKLITVKG